MPEASETSAAPADPAAHRRLALPAELTIYTAAELHPRWLQWLDAVTPDAPPLAVQASAVDQVDAAGVQLLLALAHGLTEREQMLRLHAPSSALLQACEALGLQGWARAHTDPAGAPA